MDEDWRNTFGILVCTEISDGAVTGICDGSLLTCSSSYCNAFCGNKVCENVLIN